VFYGWIDEQGWVPMTIRNDSCDASRPTTGLSTWIPKIRHHPKSHQQEKRNVFSYPYHLDTPLIIKCSQVYCHLSIRPTEPSIPFSRMSYQCLFPFFFFFILRSDHAQTSPLFFLVACRQFNWMSQTATKAGFTKNAAAKKPACCKPRQVRPPRDY